MSVKKTNKLYVDKIMKTGRYFETEGNADHDCLLIVHIQDTPKGGENSTIQVQLNGCVCHWGGILLNAVKDDPDAAEAILEAADEIRAIMTNKTANN